MQEDILQLKADLLESVETNKRYLHTDIKKLVLQEHTEMSYEDKLGLLISKFRGLAELDAVKAYVESYINIPPKENSDG